MAEWIGLLNQAAQDVMGMDRDMAQGIGHGGLPRGRGVVGKLGNCPLAVGLADHALAGVVGVGDQGIAAPVGDDIEQTGSRIVVLHHAAVGIGVGDESPAGVVGVFHDPADGVGDGDHMAAGIVA